MDKINIFDCDGIRLLMYNLEAFMKPRERMVEKYIKRYLIKRIWIVEEWCVFCGSRVIIMLLLL